jgi:hypothetical protein
MTPGLKAGALRVGRLRDCRVWAIYSAPAREHPDSVQVGVGCEAACTTGESGLRRAIKFIDIAALRTLTGRVARVHLDQRHSRQRGLVEPNFYPLAYPGQFFNRDTAPGAFSRGNDLLRYYVVWCASQSAVPCPRVS